MRDAARRLVCTVALALALLPGVASAGQLILSTHSSEMNADPNTVAEVLDATFDFEVVGTELTLSVTNELISNQPTYRVIQKSRAVQG